MADQTKPYDVAIVGGALSGASTALLLLRENPGLRVLILEKSENFSRRVGEATVEISAFFLGKILGLTAHLQERHLLKQGLRFWFANGETPGLADCSEIGPKYQVRLPGYQVDRAVLDEEVLRLAGQAGATILRPARLLGYTLEPGGTQHARISHAGGEETIEARWLVDASGVAGAIGRKEGWIQPNNEHPIASVWSRWTGVTGFDSPDLAACHPAWAARVLGTRGTATNHLCGRGWWAWIIPLKGGDVSVGAVFDTRLVELPEGTDMGERLRTLLVSHPAGKEILAGAQFTEGDVHYRNNLAYRSEVFARDGVALVGDAAGFMDPFYSPGMDWITFTAMSVTRLILDERGAGRMPSGRIEKHNRDFAASYSGWFGALYRDKYYYMGDYELMLLAFRLDLGLYYFGVVRGPLTRDRRELLEPPFSQPISRPFCALMSFYNRRLARIAQKRMRQGRWGERNAGQYYPFNSFTFDATLPWRIVRSLLAYCALEFREFFRWRTL